jgi:uncharacterized protein (TIGR02231 family)
MKNLPATCFLIVLIGLADYDVRADTEKGTSPIISVKLYQNQATIVRRTKLHLDKGLNNIVVGNLSPLLYDWSVRGSLPADFSGTINSLEVEKKALVKKRQKSIVAIEEKLEALREKDQVYVDELKNISSQEKFLNSILDFTTATGSKELATRIPQIGLWDNTLEYVTRKRGGLLKDKRAIEKEREKIGKEIQKWEFELTQIAGAGYYKNYQSLNKAILDNRSSMMIQQYADNTSQYEEKKRLFFHPTEKVDIEKRLNASIYSPDAREIDFTFSYVIPQTSWQMKYDLRASSKDKELTVMVYGDIYQKTGENWENISLSLSTGTPVNAINPPELQPWYLDLTPVYREESAGKKEMKKKAAPSGEKMQDQEEYSVEIKEAGSYVDINIPARQTIASSDKYQKKFVKSYDLRGDKNARFYYEGTPEKANSGFLKVAVRNSTDLPWLEGEAQIFVENEFMGKVTIPFTPPGKEQDLVLGVEPRIITKKELVKKFEETAGVLGGKRRISYYYKLTIENQLPRREGIIVSDCIPVARNQKIESEIKNLSLPYAVNEEFGKSTLFAQGIRRWKLTMEPHSKREISYEVVITFDKEINISGLR